MAELSPELQDVVEYNQLQFYRATLRARSIKEGDSVLISMQYERKDMRGRVGTLVGLSSDGLC